MKSFRFLDRKWIYIDANNLEEAIDKYNAIDHGALDEMVEEADEEAPGIAFWEHHSVQSIEEENEGTYQPVDDKMHVDTLTKIQ